MKIQGIVTYINHQSEIALIKTEKGNYFCDINCEGNEFLKALETFPDLKVEIEVNVNE